MLLDITDLAVRYRSNSVDAIVSSSLSRADISGRRNRRQGAISEAP